MDSFARGAWFGLKDTCCRQELPIPCPDNVLDVDVEAIGIHDNFEVLGDDFASDGFDLAYPALLFSTAVVRPLVYI
jgi:hypothetical protein